jgi:hypothetical protein
MKHSFWKQGWLLASAIVAMLAVASCGDDGAALAPELFGTWDLVSIATGEMSTDCPGEIELSDTESVSCGTQTETFNSDGTFVEIETTDELGVPYDYRTEGTWSTQGSTLSLTYKREGPDENSLQPIEPPETQNGTWNVSGSTLTFVATNPFPPNVEIRGTLEKQ